MKNEMLKSGLIALALLASATAHTQSNQSASNVPYLSSGRTFHCMLTTGLSRSFGAGLASCRLTQPVFADDLKTVAIAAGSWLNGHFNGEATLLWQAIQTGEQAGSLIYAIPDGMVSTVRGVGHAGDDLLVTVQRGVSFPQAGAKQD